MAKHTNPGSASPFPLRFARQSQDRDRGPHPGELLPFQQPEGKSLMVLADFFPPAEIQAIQQHGSISFHAFGDSGVGTAEQHAVADAMARDVDRQRPERGPAFLLHLGDILYGNDKMARYANRFYRPNDQYPNLIFGIPGNHDGEVRSELDHSSLEAYFANFCQPRGTQPPMAVSFGRAMPNQLGAYWRLTCPFVDIIGLYSGTGENFGAIAHPEIGDQQKTWLRATLGDLAAERAAGTKQALILAVHHPPYASGLQDSGFGHPGNPEMLQDIDDCCTQAKVWPDAVLSAHSHNYQRYMRTVNTGGGERTIPYYIAGGGGIGPQPVAPLGGISADGKVRYENGLQSYGYVTVTISAKAVTGSFTEVDNADRRQLESITVDLTTGRQVRSLRE
jgi:hypothetical protein